MPPSSVDDLTIELAPPTAVAPRSRRRPDEVFGAATQVGDGPAGDFTVFVAVTAIEAMFAHADEFPTVETGGLLAGEHCEDAEGPYLRVVAAIPARLASRTSTSLTFTHDAWDELLAERERLYPDLQVVGWYHTHPGLRVFLSPDDQFIHRSFFSRPQDIAVVLDLETRQWGVFQWHGDCLELAGQFRVYSESPEDGVRLPHILSRFAPVERPRNGRTPDGRGAV